MAKKKRKKKIQEKEGFDLHLNPEAKSGIIVIILITIAAIIILALFNLAGGFGVYIDNAFAIVFGWDRFLVPILLLLIGYSILFPDRSPLSAFNYIGMLFFFLSFNALLNLVAFRNDPNITADAINKAGGYIGLLLQKIFINLFDFWGGLIIILAITIVSILLIFNASLRNLLNSHNHLAAFLSRIFSFLPFVNKQEYEEDEEDEEDEEYENDEEDEEFEEADDESSKNKFRTSGLQDNNQKTGHESALTTSGPRRQIDLPVNLLEKRTGRPNSGDIARNKDIIERTFEQFGIDVEMGTVQVGPTVTQFTLRPSEGVKISRIVSLQNDLALALAAHPIRIEAPIPGQSLVGIEVPNQSVALVNIRDIIESTEFKKRKSDLSVILGKDVAGKNWISELDKMPHLLVAGATGSGKSVCLNTIIISLLYQNGPDDLKFIMVDPKRVELPIYQGIPHLLVPPITKVQETINALKWTIREMERRLDLLSKFGARDIKSYNKRSKKKMPYIVIVIDELADVMAASSHEVEGSIIRIAQMARAAGIHLIIATQRPSVDVITGLIKANFPARIAFAVASSTDSRTILDSIGAEKLLGRGDMLFSNAELSKPKRIQGAYIADVEIKKVVNHLKIEEEPDYNYVITEKERSGGSIFDSDDSDELLEDAIEVVLQAEKASTSLLQRRLKIGYSRAARIMDMLEEQGIIGPPNGSKPREILIDSWPPESNKVEESEAEANFEETDNEEYEEDESDEEEYEEDEEETEEDVTEDELDDKEDEEAEPNEEEYEEDEGEDEEFKKNEWS